MTNTDLKPFRLVDAAYDTIDLFSYSGSIPVTKGTVVKLGGSGWRIDETNIALLGSVGASYNNVTSERYGVRPYVVDAGTGDAVLGILLKDVREYDENGEKLVFHPRNADEREYVMSGRPVPILTEGLVLISGTFNGSVSAGATAYPSGNGAITVNSLNQNTASILGKFWGGVDSQGYALLHVTAH